MDGYPFPASARWQRASVEGATRRGSGPRHGSMSHTGETTLATDHLYQRGVPRPVCERLLVGVVPNRASHHIYHLAAFCLIPQ